MTKLTKEQQELLQKLADELCDMSIRVIEDYKINPSEMSGSITEVHINSPILDEKQNDTE